MLGHFHLQTESKFGTFSLTSHMIIMIFVLLILNSDTFLFLNKKNVKVQLINYLIIFIDFFYIYLFSILYLHYVTFY